jgi:hypothetical protein
VIPQTRFEANQILNLWRHGLESYPVYIINLALLLTGDLAVSQRVKAK